MDKFRFFLWKMKRRVQFFYYIFFCLSFSLFFRFFEYLKKKYVSWTFYAALLFRSLVTTFLVTRRANKMADSRTLLSLLFPLFPLFVIPAVFSEVCAPENKDVKVLKE